MDNPSLEKWQQRLDWATKVLAEAEKRTRAFFEAKGQASCWAVFEAGFLGPLKRPWDADLAREFGFPSAKAVSHAITKVRRMFGKNIRSRSIAMIENRMKSEG